MDKDLEAASLSELEALLDASRSQQKELAKELDHFILSHLDDFESLFTEIDPISVRSQESLSPVKEKYTVLQSIHETTVALQPLQKEMTIMKRVQSQAQREKEHHERLTSVEACIANKGYMSAYHLIQKIQAALEEDDETRLLTAESVSKFFDRAIDLQADLLRSLASTWNDSLIVGKEVVLTIDAGDDFHWAVEVLEMFGTLQGKVKALAAIIKEDIIQPLLACELRIVKDGSRLRPEPSGQTALAALSILVSFLKTLLPSQVLIYLCPHLAAAIVHGVRDDFLPRAVPSEVQSNARMEALANSIKALEEAMKQNDFSHSSNLSELIKDIPSLWFDRRRGVVLDQCRQLLLSWSGTTEVVEQNENVTQASLLAPVESKDPEPKSPSKQSTQVMNETDEDDWGASEWEIDDVANTKKETKETTEVVEDTDDGADAWGLDDDLLTTDTHDDQSKQNLGTVVLSTKYTISTIPKALLQLIQQCKDDSKTLAGADSALSSQHASLLALEIEILDLYKALAPVLIARTGYPRMTIYNDCIYLASHVDPSIRTFGERYYTLEIHEKLDKIHAIMERTDGLTNVTVPMQKDVCYAAIQEVLDLLTRTAERYEAQLGRTTLCTALGTLGDAAIVYFVDSVMAMTDISAAESTELAKMGDTLTRLEGLFRGQEDGETVLTAMWCPNWFRFRLLLDILEAKLDYILQLWHDGDLVDFEPGEVTELIRALFSDSPKRRGAIEQIMN